MQKSILGQEQNLQNSLQNYLQGVDPAYLDGLYFICKERFQNYTHILSCQQAQETYLALSQRKSSSSRKNWKKKQIALLLYLVDKACAKTDLPLFHLPQNQWEKISDLIPGKSSQSCKEKILSLIPSRLSKTPWNEEEQELLLDIVEKQGTQWKKVAFQLFDKNPQKIYRSSKQCREHYACFLKPNLKKGFWTDEEDYKLLSLYICYGRKWSKLAKQLPGRNENAIKNRFSLLFDNKDRNCRPYPSEILRKVKRKKEALEKQLKNNNKLLEMPSNSVSFPQKVQDFEVKQKEASIEKRSNEDKTPEIHEQDFEKYFTF